MQGGSSLAERLRSLLQLNKYEASAYLALLRLGAARAADVAREAGVPPQRIYDVLRSLAEMGLVAESDGVFSPVDPARAMDELAQRELVEAARRASEISELGRELASIYRSGARAPPRIVKGLDAVLAAALSAASRCGEKAYFMAYKVFERLPQVLPALRQLVASLPKGAIVVVPPGSVSRYSDLAGEFQSMGVSFAESPLAFLDVMVACDTVIIGLTHGGDAVALVAEDRELAEALRARMSQAAGVR